MTSDAVVQEVGGRPTISWWQVLRAALVLGWVVWAGLSWWMTPRESTIEQARTDLTSGHVVSYEWGRGWAAQSGLFRPGGAQLESSGSEGPIFLWHTDDGRQHYTTVDGGVPTDELNPADDPTSPTGTDGDELAPALRAFNAGESATASQVSTVAAGLAIAGAVLFLWALVSAPDPVTGTKWFWFWLVSTVPFGLGLLWWLARERPWWPRARPRTGRDGEPKRLKWWAGIGVGFLVGLGLSLAVIGLHNLLGDAVVPLPQ